MKSQENSRSNSAFYPIAFFLLIPAAGGSAALEFGLFGSSASAGVLYGFILGSVLFMLFKQKRKKDSR